MQNYDAIMISTGDSFTMFSDMVITERVQENGNR